MLCKSPPTPSGGRHQASAYDSAGRLIWESNPLSERTTFQYDAADRRTVKRLDNGTRTSFSYDAANQTTHVSQVKSDGTVFQQLEYGYDAAGNRTSLAELDGSRVTWPYDAQSQLLGEHRTGTTPYRQTYTYDPAGNRTLKNIDGTRTSYAYDVANQLIYGETTAGRTTYTFDPNGNQQIEQEPNSDRTTTIWDFENQPSGMLLPDGNRITYTYNADFRRVRTED